MSELISGKEALIAFASGEKVEYFDTRDTFKELGWACVSGMQAWLFLDDASKYYKFRIKPKTTILNGVEVGRLVSAQWSRDEPNKVKLEFNNPEDANYFRSKALEIFNFNKGCEK